MDSEIEKEVEMAVMAECPVMLSGGSPSERKSIVDGFTDSVLLSVDCETVSTRKEVAESLYPREADGGTLQEWWWAIEDELKSSDSAIFFRNFDSLPHELQDDLSKRIKGLFELSSATIFVTAADSSTLTRANPDLSGRVKHVSLD